MEILRVDRAPQDQGPQNFREWTIKTNRLLGLPDDAWVYSDSAPYEFVWIGESLYRRCLERNEGFFYLEVGNGDPPHVMCQCGSFEFTLRYDLYELKGTCARCGETGTVYEG